MKKPILAWFLANLLFAPFFAAAQLTGAEGAFLRKCRDNVSPEMKQLSAATAAECVRGLNADNAALLNRFKREAPDTAAEVISFSNALLDLKNIVVNNSGEALLKHLERVLENATCPLCDMKMGPRPEQIFDWVEKEASGRLPEVKRSVRTWEALGKIRTGSLSSGDYRYDRERWNAQNIWSRYAVLYGWASKETNNLSSLYGPGFFERKPDPGLIAVLREDLEAGRTPSTGYYIAQLDRMSGDSGKAGKGKKEGLSSVEKKGLELSVADGKLEEMKNKSEGDQAAFLSETFDRAGPHAGDISKTWDGSAGKKPYVFKPFSGEQAAALPGRLLTSDAKGNLRGPMADELRGTKAGDEILAFYKEPAFAKTGTNRLNFVFEAMDEMTLGGWVCSEKVITLNIRMVDDWMKANKVSPEQLFQGAPGKNEQLRALSRYLAPTIVHESTHQRYDAWATANGVNYRSSGDAPYQMQMEIEAYSMSAGFMAEKLWKNGPAYAAGLRSFDKTGVEFFIEKGVEGVSLAQHRVYHHLESFEGSAAKEFARAAGKANELKSLEIRNTAFPGSLSPGEIKKMLTLRSEMDSRFKWYALVYEKAVADEAKMNAWRKEINGRMYPSSSVNVAAPPEL